jgi:hypothetical protein
MKKIILNSIGYYTNMILDLKTLTFAIQMNQYVDYQSYFKRLNLKVAFLLLFAPCLIQAQTTLQVASKNIEKVFENASMVQLTAERADIDIKVWNKPMIKVSIELSAKHPNREIATQDLAIWQYLGEQIGKKVYLRNFVQINASLPKPQSNLKANYTIWLPATCELLLQDTFGNVSIEGLSKKLDLNSQFCAIKLDELKGKVTLRTAFGSLLAQNIEGNIGLYASRTDMSFHHLKGECQIKAEYGSLELLVDKTLVKLGISAPQTTIKYLNAISKNDK